MFDFLSIQSTVQSVNKKRDDLLEQIRQSEASLTQIRHAPANRSDIVELVSNWVDASSSKLGAVVHPNIAKRFRVGSPAPIQGTPPKRGVLVLLENEGDQLDPEVLGALMCSAFSPQIKAAIGASIKQMDWPGEGLPQTKRAEEVGKRETQVQKLREELSKLEEGARQAGIQLD